MYVYMYLCMNVGMYVRMYVRMFLRMYVRMYVCMYVCMHVCMYEFLCVCMYEYACMFGFALRVRMRPFVCIRNVYICVCCACRLADRYGYGDRRFIRVRRKRGKLV